MIVLDVNIGFTLCIARYSKILIVCSWGLWEGGLQILMMVPSSLIRSALFEHINKLKLPIR